MSALPKQQTRYNAKQLTDAAAFLAENERINALFANLSDPQIAQKRADQALARKKWDEKREKEQKKLKNPKFKSKSKSKKSKTKKRKSNSKK